MNIKKAVVLVSNLIILVVLLNGCRKEHTQSTDQEIIVENSQDSIGKNQHQVKKSLTIYNGVSNEKIELKKPTVLIQELDSLEIEQLITIYGESNFYTGSDDLMYYNSMLLKKMDSLNIDMIYSSKDTLFIKANDVNVLVNKNLNSPLFSYYFFDGQIVRKTDVFELLGNQKITAD